VKWGPRLVLLSERGEEKAIESENAYGMIVLTGGDQAW